MAGDVEEFLRRLIEKQMGQQPQRPAPQQPQRPAQQRPAQPRQAPAARRPVPRRLKAEIIEDVVEVIDAEPVEAESVARHVSKHLDAGEFQSRTGRMGAGVRQEEAALQSHFKDTFGGGPRVSLNSTSSAATGAATGGAADSSNDAATTAAAAIVSGPSLASQVLNTIGSPNDLRRAFILGEVLRRPDFDKLFE